MAIATSGANPKPSQEERDPSRSVVTSLQIRIPPISGDFERGGADLDYNSASFAGTNGAVRGTQRVKHISAPRLDFDRRLPQFRGRRDHRPEALSTRNGGH